MRLHLVDGTFELFRAHYSPRPGRLAPDGRDVKATVGVVASLLYLLQEEAEKVTHIAVAFDNPIRSFRNDLFAAYKSDEGMDPALRAQFDPVEEACRAIGVHVFSMRDFEADDALAAAAFRFRDQVEQVRILTPDKDLGQCLSGERVVQVDRIRKTEWGEDGLRKRRGIGPESIPDWLALTGDDADGIPGLPGFGEKTAALLLGHFVRLEQIPPVPMKWPKDVRGALRLSATLEQQREDAMLYRTLATLRTDAPIVDDLDELRFRGVPREAFHAWCDSLGVADWKDRPTRWAAG